MKKTYQIRYFAALREQRGLSSETYNSAADTPADLYAELSLLHGLTLPTNLVKAAVGDAFVPMDTILPSDCDVAFMPPMAGG